VKENKRTEKQQKDLIFDNFSKYINEPEIDRIKAYQIICEQIYRWYKDYKNIDIDETGLAIVQVISHLLKKETISKIPKDKDGFFKYLSSSIETEKKGLYYEYNENDLVNIPKEKKRKLRKVEDFIRMKESQLGRKLTNNERIQGVSKWFYISEKKAREYLYLINNKNVSSLDVKNSKGEENNILDSEDLKPPYQPRPYEEPESSFFTNFNDSNIIEAVKFVLDNKHEKTRDCYKALFTLYCIKNDLKELYPILDQEIIDSFHKDGKEPNQYEIYMKYHPKAIQESAGSMASTNLREFLKDIKNYLKVKNY